MPAYYLDTSVTAKAYSEEEGADRVEDMLNRATEVYLSRVGVVEVAAAFFGKTKTGELAVVDAASLLQEFQVDLYNVYQVIEVVAETSDLAITVAEKHHLRAYDCLQLATALLLHEQRVALRMEPLILASSDEELNAVAANEGLLVEDPAES